MSQRIQSLSDTLARQLRSRRINKAIITLEALCDATSAPADCREEAKRIAIIYRRMATDLLGGHDDPKRADRYARIVDDINSVASRCRRSDRSVESYVDRLARCYQPGSAATPADTEEAMRELFKRLWLNSPLSLDDRRCLADRFFADEAMDASAKKLMVSALLLSLLQDFDDSAIYLLLYTFHVATDSRLRARALTAALIALSLYPSRELSPATAGLISTLSDNPDWSKWVTAIYAQLIRGLQTEKTGNELSRNLQSQLMRLRTDISKKFSEEQDLESTALESFEMNPEWEEMLEKSGMLESMRDLSEMMNEGMDVMMSLPPLPKNNRFFRDVASWFMPFPAPSTQLSQVNGPAAMMFQIPMLCDNDKFSLYFMLADNADHINTMLRNYGAAGIDSSDLDEAMRDYGRGDDASEFDPVDYAEIINYVQSLYRFFKLSTMKQDFADPFATSLDLTAVEALAPVFDAPDQLKFFADFYFHRKFLPEAFTLFKRLEERGDIGASDLQKMGYCLEQQGDYEGAVGYYDKAAILRPDDVWTLRHLAHSLRLAGRYDAALTHYTRLATLRPDDLKVALHTGHCLAELGRYADALRQYFKVEYLDPQSGKALRPIAWACFLNGDFDRSRDYYSRLDPATLKPADLLNIAHLDMATRHFEQAIEGYRKVLGQVGRQELTQMMQADIAYLRSVGVEDLMIGLVLDTLFGNA